jgi:hypothetical protein
MMGFFEQLGPFMRLCQCVGLFPYRVETSSGRFKRFVFSWFHIVTGWFIASICLQILPTLISWGYIFLQDQVYANVSNNNEPKTIVVIFGASVTLQYLKVVVVRVISLRYNLLNTATSYLNTHVIKELEDVHNTFYSEKGYGTIYKRTIVGIILIFIKVRHHMFF